MEVGQCPGGQGGGRPTFKGGRAATHLAAFDHPMVDMHSWSRLVVIGVGARQK